MGCYFMPMRASTISVVLPNYNHGQYIKRAIGALFAQDFPPYEVIVVDDASTDDSLAIIHDIALTHPNIRIIKNEWNEGLVLAQRRGRATATGKYIYLAAADDWIMPGFFSFAVEMLEAWPQA